MGIAALVLGIVSVVWSCFGGTWLSAVVGIVGIVLGAVGRKKEAKCATAGFVLISSVRLWACCFTLPA